MRCMGRNTSSDGRIEEQVGWLPHLWGQLTTTSIKLATPCDLKQLQTTTKTPVAVVAVLAAPSAFVALGGYGTRPFLGPHFGFV